MFEFSMSSRVDHWAGICNDVFSFSVNVPLRYWISCGAGITDNATGFVFVICLGIVGRIYEIPYQGIVFLGMMQIGSKLLIWYCVVVCQV